MNETKPRGVRRLPHVHAVRLDAKGRGRALKHVWSRSTADVVRDPKREFLSRSYNTLLKRGRVDISLGYAS